MAPRYALGSTLPCAAPGYGAFVSTTFSAFLGGSLVESFTAASDSGFPADSGRFYGFEGIVFDEIRLSINAVNMGANLDNL